MLLMILQLRVLLTIPAVVFFLATRLLFCFSSWLFGLAEVDDESQEHHGEGREKV